MCSFFKGIFGGAGKKKKAKRPKKGKGPKKKKGKKKAKGEKVKLALYWGATCGGCDIAVLDLEEKILDVAAIADILLWPIAMDFKYKDIEALPDTHIDVTLFNGAIVNSENKEVAELLRKKSKVLIAFGSCSCFGGIPGLSNVATKDQIFKEVFKETPSTINPDYVTPKTRSKVEGHKLTLPEMFDTTKALHQVVDVDYYLPGCPPAVEMVAKAVGVIADFAKTGNLPPKGAVIASDKSQCNECKLRKEDRMVSEIKRPHEILPDPERCLLEQGIICMGPATRAGCGTRCMNALMPCRGCMGPLPNVEDQGAKMLSAIAAIFGAQDETSKDEEGMALMMEQIKDPLGTFYRFCLPVATIDRVREKGGEG